MRKNTDYKIHGNAITKSGIKIWLLFAPLETWRGLGAELNCRAIGRRNKAIS